MGLDPGALTWTSGHLALCSECSSSGDAAPAAGKMGTAAGVGGVRKDMVCTWHCVSLHMRLVRWARTTHLKSKLQL